MGIGLLVMFISVIVLVAIAVTILLSAGAGYQQKAFNSEREVEEGILTGLDIIMVTAGDASSNDDTPGTIEDFDITVKLRGGSDPVNLNRTVIILEHEDGSAKWAYAGTVGENGIPSDNSHFVAYYMAQTSKSVEGHVTRGDVVKLRVNVSEAGSISIAGRDKLRLTFIHRMGITNRLDMATPDSLVQAKVNLYPPII